MGDILRSMWGYEQTNIDYYEVTALIGKHTVEIREVSRQSEETQSMQGVCVPVPGAYIGEPMRKRADESGSVKINSFAWARKVEAKTVAGVKLFSPDPRLFDLQAEARAERRGLWADPNPVEPWVWRQVQKNRPR